MVNIAILASGSGTNAENIMRCFQGNSNIRVACVITNNKNAFVLERAKQFDVDTVLFEKNDFEAAVPVIKYLTEHKIHFIVLAGFLLKIPQAIVNLYPNNILNIHPALLPKYGGKGMYGDCVHKAVVANGEVESGITIHYVNENYDEGAVVFQTKCSVLPSDTYQDVAGKVHELEYLHFPRVIEEVLKGKCFM